MAKSSNKGRTAYNGGTTDLMAKHGENSEDSEYKKTIMLYISLTNNRINQPQFGM